MAEYRLTERAVADLESIFDYSADPFGFSQAEFYLLGLAEALLKIVATPKLAHSIQDIRADYYRYLYEQHAIYFQRLKAATGQEASILVVRVLHQRMQVSLHLQ